jgi:hypothetical protein
MVTVPSADQLNPGTSNFSVTGYARSTAAVSKSGNYYMWGKGTARASGGHFVVEMKGTTTRSAGKVRCTFRGSQNKDMVVSSKKINDGQWHQVTCEKTDSAIAVVVDGARTQVPTTIGSIANTAPFLVGGDGTSFFPGDMDELSVTSASGVTLPPPPPPTGTGVLVAAAGDIACSPGMATTSNRCQQAATGRMVSSGNYDAVLTLGDNQYDCGKLSDFQSVYDPTWGAVKAKTHPIPGDNDYAGNSCKTPGATGYFSYFQQQAGSPGCTTACDGWYSYDLGDWHVIALNSECGRQSGAPSCAAQLQWLESDLAADSATCTLAYVHRPYWANANVFNGDKSIVTALYNGGADVLLSGHVHGYARYAPQDPGSKVTSDGITQFIVGTGGRSHSKLKTPTLPNLQASSFGTYGVLQLSLDSGSYSWKYLTTGGATADSGSASCH